MELNNKFDNYESDDGYSEKKLDKSTDLVSGQWLDLSKGASALVKAPTKQSVSGGKSRLQKLVEYSQSLMREIDGKVNEYGDEARENKDLSRLAKEIEKLQSKLHTILRSIQFEQKGTLDITKLPKEAQDLVK
ncbi:MAG: hypothetical protein KBC15_00610 [Candidatus Levybacteria bacterium]|nr:hypothetical protein [Candidatus Levybacteria bacterium]